MMAQGRGVLPSILQTRMLLLALALVDAWGVTQEKDLSVSLSSQIKTSDKNLKREKQTGFKGVFNSQLLTSLRRQES